MRIQRPEKETEIRVSNISNNARLLLPLLHQSRPTAACHLGIEDLKKRIATLN